MKWLIGKLKLLWRPSGYTLLEVLIAVSILGVIGAALLTAINTNSRATRNLDEQVEGANLAVAHIEVIKEMPYAATYPNVAENITIPMQYTVDVEAECSADGSTFAVCTGSDNETLQKITAVVSREGRPVVALCTYRTKR